MLQRYLLPRWHTTNLHTKVEAMEPHHQAVSQESAVASTAELTDWHTEYPPQGYGAPPQGYPPQQYGAPPQGRKYTNEGLGLRA